MTPVVFRQQLLLPQEKGHFLSKLVNSAPLSAPRKAFEIGTAVFTKGLWISFQIKGLKGQVEFYGPFFGPGAKIWMIGPL
jgi:predicted O-methyltransferase YrrM